MKNDKMMKLPACCAVLTEEEMTYTEGGGAVETLAGAAIAVGATVALAYAGGAILGGVGSFFGETVIGAALTTGASLMTAPGAAVAGVVGGLLGIA